MKQLRAGLICLLNSLLISLSSVIKELTKNWLTLNLFFHQIVSAVLLIPTCLSFVLLDPSSGRPVELRQPYWMADSPALQMLSAPSALAPSQVNLLTFINLYFLSLQDDMHQIYSFVSEYNRASRRLKRLTKLRSFFTTKLDNYSFFSRTKFRRYLTRVHQRVMNDL
jgi:hypothetical protein